MENLLRNAIRHSPEDGTVSLDGEREGDFWHLRLQDQGPGVAEDQLERIFLPYQRLEMCIRDRTWPARLPTSSATMP